MTESGENEFGMALIVISDRIAAGEKEDRTVPRMMEWCERKQFRIIFHRIVSDDPDEIEAALAEAIGMDNVRLVITNGGTGFTPRDITPEVTRKYIEKPTPGIDEYLRRQSAEKTRYAPLSRGISGIHNDRLIVNMPGSPGAVIDNMNALTGILPHALTQLKGRVPDHSHEADNGEDKKGQNPS